MKTLRMCGDCEYTWRSSSERTYCPSCSSAATSVVVRREGRPDKYPWDQWAEDIRTSGKPLQFVHDSKQEASRFRSRICSNYVRRQQFRVALRKCIVYLHLIA